MCRTLTYIQYGSPRLSYWPSVSRALGAGVGHGGMGHGPSLDAKLPGPSLSNCAQQSGREREVRSTTGRQFVLQKRRPGPGSSRTKLETNPPSSKVPKVPLHYTGQRGPDHELSCFCASRKQSGQDALCWLGVACPTPAGLAAFGAIRLRGSDCEGHVMSP